ncbi:MAG: hypothetical protein AAFW98_17940, partial [Pseudomonadota bacterium]
ILTPRDAVYAPAGLEPVEGLREHIITDPQVWIAARGKTDAAPETLSPFNALSKADYRTIARNVSAVKLPDVQHFWHLVGDHGQMAQTMMPTSRMIRTGVGGPFDAMTPTLIFVDPARVDDIAALPLRQSTFVLAPFAIPAGEAVDMLLTAFVDARREPFHLHDVLTFGDVEGATVGCLYGEYVM